MRKQGAVRIEQRAERVHRAVRKYCREQGAAREQHLTKLNSEREESSERGRSSKRAVRKLNSEREESSGKVE